MKRTAKEIIEDIRSDALMLEWDSPVEGLEIDIRLVVIFETEKTEYILHGDSAALEKLKDCVRRGGEPVGIVLMAIENPSRRVTIRAKPLQEYIGCSAVVDHLQNIVDATFKDLSK